MPETPWPEGRVFKLASAYDGGGSISTWSSEAGDKLGKFYDLDDYNVNDYKASSWINIGTNPPDKVLQVLGVMKTERTKYEPIRFPRAWPKSDGTWWNLEDWEIWDNRVWGVIANTYPYKDDKTISLQLNKDTVYRNAINVDWDDVKHGARSEKNHPYKYLTKSGNIYTKPSTRTMCPGNPVWGFKANKGSIPSEIRCRYDWTEGDMNALAASIQNLGQGADDQTDVYDQIMGILKTYCSRGDNMTKSLGATGSKLSCKDIVGDVGLLSNFCRSSDSNQDGTFTYNVMKHPDLCSYDNLETDSDGNYRAVWKNVCEKPSMYDADPCRLFWATESTMAAKPEDNPGIEDPCAPGNSLNVCNATQGVIDNIDEAVRDSNIKSSVSGAQRRLCYGGSGRGSNRKYEWEKVIKDPGLCNTQIQICNQSLGVSGAVKSDFDQSIVCIQSGESIGSGDDIDIKNQREATETPTVPAPSGTADSASPAPDEPKKKSFVARYWWVILLIIVLVMMMILGIVIVA